MNRFCFFYLPLMVAAALLSELVVRFPSKDTKTFHRGDATKVKTMDGEMVVVFNGEQFLEVARFSTNNAPPQVAATNTTEIEPRNVLDLGEKWEKMVNEVMAVAKEWKGMCRAAWKVSDEHYALRHGDFGIFSIVPEPGFQSDENVCEHVGFWISASGGAPLPPILKITMPCGYCWELRWGEQAPSESVQCPCGNPDHWVIRLEPNATPFTNTFSLLP